jgi:hypothetical protein
MFAEIDFLDGWLLGFVLQLLHSCSRFFVLYCTEICSNVFVVIHLWQCAILVSDV